MRLTITITAIAILLGMAGTTRAQGTAPDCVDVWTGLTTPRDLDVGPNGQIYVVESGADRIRTYNANGGPVGMWGATGSGDGEFQSPEGVAVDGNGNVYVTDRELNRVQKFDANGTFLLKWGSSDGSAGVGDGEFNFPTGVAVDGSGNIYVMDTLNNRVQKFDSNGAFLLMWGAPGSLPGQFGAPFGIAAAPDGTIYVPDFGNNRVQRFSSDGVFQAEWGSFGLDGNDQFNGPVRAAVDPAGDVYVADRNNNRVIKFTSNGAYLAQWGSADLSGGSAPGEFNHPHGVGIDAGFNIFVTDTDNNRIQKLSFCAVSLEPVTWGRIKAKYK